MPVMPHAKCARACTQRGTRLARNHQEALGEGPGAPGESQRRAGAPAVTRSVSVAGVRTSPRHQPALADGLRSIVPGGPACTPVVTPVAWRSMRPSLAWLATHLVSTLCPGSTEVGLGSKACAPSRVSLSDIGRLKRRVWPGLSAANLFRVAQVDGRLCYL